MTSSNESSETVATPDGIQCSQVTGTNIVADGDRDEETSCSVTSERQKVVTDMNVHISEVEYLKSLICH